MKKRMNLEIPDDLEQKVILWANKLGVSKTNLINLSIRSGLDSLIRAISPADAFTADQMVDIFQAAKARGIDLDENKKAD